MIKKFTENTYIDIPEEIIIEAIKNISETELNYMSEIYGYLDIFFEQNESHLNQLFTKDEEHRFDAYVNEFGEEAVVACLIKNILEKL